MKGLNYIFAGICIGIGLLIGFWLFHHVAVKASAPVRPSAAREMVYIKNLAPRYYSDKAIRNAIPAWEKAANQDFAPIWHSPQVSIVLLRRHQSAPKGGIVAVFKQKGPIQGALAFHYVLRGVPSIVVYAGTDDYYGFNNSVSFTHELFEMLADHTISQTNQGYQYPFYYIGNAPYEQVPGTVWANEVSDPVEKYSYRIGGVEISDFVTPNWYNDHVDGGYDFMGVVQQPFQIVQGGYACFVQVETSSINGLQYGWNCVQNFRHAGRDAAGFFRGEQEAKR